MARRAARDRAGIGAAARLARQLQRRAQRGAHRGLVLAVARILLDAGQDAALALSLDQSLGATARVLADLERVLTHEIVAELRYLEGLAGAA